MVRSTRHLFRVSSSQQGNVSGQDHRFVPIIQGYAVNENGGISHLPSNRSVPACLRSECAVILVDQDPPSVENIHFHSVWCRSYTGYERVVVTVIVGCKCRWDEYISSGFHLYSNLSTGRTTKNIRDGHRIDSIRNSDYGRIKAIGAT